MRTVLALAAAVLAWQAATWAADRFDALFLFEVPVKVLAAFAALGLTETALKRLWRP